MPTKEYYQKHKEELRRKNREYYQKHKEEIAKKRAIKRAKKRAMREVSSGNSEKS
ncbi:MAG: hypothetical protein ACTSR2_01420 [Candidatus Hodarchaeales archaeon]